MSNFHNRIFIGGLPRSGTTMVQNILDSHPEIYGGPEFDRIPNILDLRNKLLRSLEAGRIKVYTSKATINKSIANLVDALFEGVLSDQEFKFISEKTPWNILFFEELIEVFPAAKFVMVVRNPLDVFSSMKNVASNAKAKNIKPPDFTTNYKIAVGYMEAVYKNMEVLLFKYPTKVYLIRYEDLLSNLEYETRKLCDFIGVEWTEHLMKFNTIKHPGEETMTKDGIWYTKSMYKANPNNTLTNKKKSTLTFIEKSFINYIFFKNSFINKNNCYFKTLSVSNRIIGKCIYYNFKNKYRFYNLPKRVLS